MHGDDPGEQVACLVELHCRPGGSKTRGNRSAPFGFTSGGEPHQLASRICAAHRGAGGSDRADRHREEHRQRAESERSLHGDCAPITVGRTAGRRRAPEHQNVAVSARWMSVVSAPTIESPLTTA